MKYWAYMKGEVPGSYEPAALAALPGFTMTTLVCPGEGVIAEKNWRRAGEFDDIVRALQSFQSQTPPAAPLGAPPTANEVDALLDTASTRLFSHVADLMRELETRRDEKSLIVALQRQISALKEELASARETTTLLELRIPRITELEEAQSRHHAVLAPLQASLAARERELDELRAALESTRKDLDDANNRALETESQLVLRNRLVEKLSQDLSMKEQSLEKSLGVIRRLEEDLSRLYPSPAAEEPVQVLSVPECDTPPPPLPALIEAPPPVESSQSPEPPPLMTFLRKVFPGHPH